MRRAPCVLFCAFLFSACSRAPSVVGNWESTINVLGQDATHSVTYTGDGRFIGVVKLVQDNNITLTATDKGTWKLKGEKLVIKVDDVDWKFTGPDPARIARAHDVFNRNKAEILKGSNRQPEHPIEWSGADSFTITTADGEKATYRKKA